MGRVQQYGRGVIVLDGGNSLGRMQLFGKAVYVVTMPAAKYTSS